MKSHFHRIPLFLLCASFASAEPPGIDQSLEFVTPPAGSMFIRWHGQPVRSYFIMVSDPADHLRAWRYAPNIEAGNDVEISYEVDGTADKGFFRLLYTDDPTTDPELEDFAGDGIGSMIKVLMGLNPFVPLAWVDVDEDGIHDAIEQFWFGSLIGSEGDEDDANGNGIRDIFEIAAGNDPTVDLSGEPDKRSNYSYDSMGRLTEADGVTYDFDIEGNLETSN